LREDIMPVKGYAEFMQQVERCRTLGRRWVDARLAYEQVHRDSVAVIAEGGDGAAADRRVTAAAKLVRRLRRQYDAVTDDLKHRGDVLKKLWRQRIAAAPSAQRAAVSAEVDREQELAVAAWDAAVKG